MSNSNNFVNECYFLEMYLGYWHKILIFRFRDDAEIKSDKRHEITNVDTSYTLKIKDACEDDDAEYKATASNSAGSVSTIAEILVNPAPVQGGWLTCCVSAAPLICALVTHHQLHINAQITHDFYRHLYLKLLETLNHFVMLNHLFTTWCASACISILLPAAQIKALSCWSNYKVIHYHFSFHSKSMISFLLYNVVDLFNRCLKFFHYKILIC